MEDKKRQSSIFTNMMNAITPSVPAVRLSQAYVPIHYDIFLHPNIPGKAFNGQVDITVKCNEKTNQMELHIDQTIIVISVSQKNGKAVTHRIEGCKLIIGGDNLEEAPISISYHGSLNNNLKGFYYIDDNNCCSQFEPNDARKAFPCFDEPCIKATFTIKIRSPSYLKALSNMPAISVTADGNESVTIFQETPPMCSYLVAFAIGQYSCLTGHTSRGLPVDIYASPENARFLQFPLEEAIKALDYLEVYFDLEFDLPRLQILAAKRFLLGGMENYGLIIIMESLFLTSPEEARNTQQANATTQSEEQMLDMISSPQILDTMVNFIRKASLTQLSAMMDEQTASITMKILSPMSRLSILSQVITHEIVHMWAGDMVSPAWWDALWLNEGFATLLPSLMFDEYHPEFTFLRRYDDMTNQIVFSLDAIENARPIHGRIVSEDDSFDMMSYNKAGFVLQMIRNIVGPEAFVRAYRVFLKKFYHKSADTADILQVFKENFTFDVQKFFDAWIYREGFPLIIVEENSIRQIPFFGEENRIWPIPLKILYGKNNEVKTTIVFLENEEIDLNIDADWIVVDPRIESFCKVWHAADWLTKAITLGLVHLNERERCLFKMNNMLLLSRGYVDKDDIQLMNSYLLSFQ